MSPTSYRAAPPRGDVFVASQCSHLAARSQPLVPPLPMRCGYPAHGQNGRHSWGGSGARHRLTRSWRSSSCRSLRCGSSWIGSGPTMPRTRQRLSDLETGRATPTAAEPPPAPASTTWDTPAQGRLARRRAAAGRGDRRDHGRSWRGARRRALAPCHRGRPHQRAHPGDDQPAPRDQPGDRPTSATRRPPGRPHNRRQPSRSPRSASTSCARTRSASPTSRLASPRPSTSSSPRSPTNGARPGADHRCGDVPITIAASARAANTGCRAPPSPR